MDGCGWLNIRLLTVYHTLRQFFKTVRWGSPIHLRDRIEIDEDTDLYRETKTSPHSDLLQSQIVTGLKMSLDLHCSLTKVNRHFGSKKFSLMGFKTW